MSNIDLIARMSQVLDEYEAGRLSSLKVERAIQAYIGSMEGIDLRTIHQSGDLTFRLVSALPPEEAVGFIGTEDVHAVLYDLRRFLRSLPESPGA